MTPPPDSDAGDHDVEPPAPTGRPGLLVGALALVAVEVLALAVLSLLIVVGLLSSADDDALAAATADATTAVSLAVVLLGLGALLAVGARALWQGRRWGRGPVVTWQLLQFFIGISALGADTWWATILPAVVAVAVLIGVLAPTSRDATDGRAQPDAVL